MNKRHVLFCQIGYYDRYKIDTEGWNIYTDWGWQDNKVRHRLLLLLYMT